MQVNEFAEQYQKLCFAYNKPVEEGRMEVFYEYLGNMKAEAFRYAVSSLIIHAKFFPSVAEIIDAAREYRETIPVTRQLKDAEYEPITEETMKEFRDLRKKLFGGCDA